jgi:hypothetical protein
LAAFATAGVSDEKYEELRLILERQNDRTYTFEEAKEIGDGLLDFFGLLIQAEKKRLPIRRFLWRKKLNCLIDMNETYDLAFSFAGEHRSYVEAVKNECVKLGLKVFYDKDKNNEWWGKNFISEQRNVYSEKTKYFIPFISPEYFNKPIPADEFESAIWQSLQKGDDPYILPVRIGKADVPTNKLHPTIHYLKAEDYTPAELAQQMYKKVKGSSAPAPKEVQKILDDALDLPMPKIVPRNYSKYEAAESLLEYIAQKFQQNLPKLQAEGYAPIVRKGENSIKILVEYDGRTLFVANFFFSSMGDSQIGYNFDVHSMMANANSQNGYIEPQYDKQSHKEGYVLADGFQPSGIVSRDEIVKFFWNKMNDRLETEGDRA